MVIEFSIYAGYIDGLCLTLTTVNTGEPQALVAWGLSSCARALAGIVSRTGAKGWARRCHRSGAQGSRKPPSPRQKLWSSQARPDLFVIGVTRACPMGIAPKPPSDSEGVGQGSSLFGNHSTQGLTYLYVRISSGAPEPFMASPSVMATKG